ncbi:LysR substrate-binding domain-containing protein [Aestuariispira insulae]|uniref:LysR family transcriptional regulator n=1 Tax=Aestuariispira insulae TaxID=1461337 RepID=A0A3D9HJU9_9PROT|nr:LysR substrate-binding domain-containing protein [Aestuariispira insulae]RED49743.1 LysR family transcriptional regulator [Aestuariispira insulae]
MNYSRLRAFHAVAQHGSYTRAAQAVNISQPTLSDHVKALETDYGVKLFKPKGRGVELTALGARLLEKSRSLMAQEAAIDRMLREAGDLATGHLTVGADAPHNIIPLLSAFSRHYPGIEVALKTGNTAQIQRDLLEGRVDVAVRSEAGYSERLVSEVLQRADLIAFVSVDDPWARKNSVELSDLVGRRLIVRERDSATRTVFEQFVYSAGLTFSDMMEIGSREAVKEAVAAGFGVGIIADTELGQDERLKSIAIRGSEMEILEYIVCLRERRSEKVINALFEQLDNWPGRVI